MINAAYHRSESKTQQPAEQRHERLGRAEGDPDAQRLARTRMRARSSTLAQRCSEGIDRQGKRKEEERRSDQYCNNSRMKSRIKLRFARCLKVVLRDPQSIR
ncbi:MAG: hypothetical protein WKH97_17555 [Casimicrobiaceae bacterium]